MRLACFQGAEIEAQRAVFARLAVRLRLDRVDAHALEPAGAELQPSILQRAAGRDVEPGLIDVARADARRPVDVDACGRPRCRERGRPLPEDVQESEHHYERQQQEESAPHPDLTLPASEIAVARKDDAVGNTHCPALPGTPPLNPASPAARNSSRASRPVRRAGSTFIEAVPVSRASARAWRLEEPLARHRACRPSAALEPMARCVPVAPEAR